MNTASTKKIQKKNQTILSWYLVNFTEHKQPSQVLMLRGKANGILQHEKYLYTHLRYMGALYVYVKFAE